MEVPLLFFFVDYRFKLLIVWGDIPEIKLYQNIHFQLNTHFCSNQKHFGQAHPKNVLILFLNFLSNTPCVKSVLIRSYSGLYSVQMRENTDQNNSEYGHYSRSDSYS